MNNLRSLSRSFFSRPQKEKPRRSGGAFGPNGLPSGIFQGMPVNAERANAPVQATSASCYSPSPHSPLFADLNQSPGMRSSQ